MCRLRVPDIGYYSEFFILLSLDRVEEADIQTQTDAFLDRPPTPLFVPAKTGVDVSTQIAEGDVSGIVYWCTCVCRSGQFSLSLCMPL